MVWYFISVYIINRTLHGRLEIRNFVSPRGVSPLWIILTPRHPPIKYILSKPTFISHYLEYLLSIFWFINTFFCCLAEPLCVIVELVSGGSLDKILRSSRVQPERDLPTYSNIWSRLTERELLKIAFDVANGMKHLESKKVRLKSMSWVSSKYWKL